MKKLSRLMLVCLLACSMSLAVDATASASNDSNEIVASFLKHVAQSELTAAKKSEVESAVKSLEGADAITEGLIKMYPEYSKAVESSDDDNVADATRLLTPMLESKDKYLAADASFYLARTLMNNEKYEDAMPMLKNLMGELGKYSAQAGTSHYYAGVAHAGMLENDKAVEKLMEFLQFNKNAPERLQVSAWRRVQEIQAIEEGKMDDVAQRMDYSRRRLDNLNGDDQTQEEQDKIISMLNELIKEEEKKECSS